MDVLVGADPEFFVKRNGHWVSAHSYKCGTKKDPMPTKHGFIQNDGMALEVNVLPAMTEDAFVENAWGVISDLREFLRGQDKTADIYAVPSVHFGKKTWDYAPAEAKELGCEPDFNAYTMKMNPRPKVTDKITFRTGAGHIHVGWTNGQNPRSIKHMQECARVVKELDFRIGLSSLEWDQDPLRRHLYGKAGAFRPKAYGLEYRVPSNKLFSNPKFVRHAFRHAVDAIHCVITKKDELYHRYEGIAQAAIDTNNRNWRKDWVLLADMVLP
jgi:hypothetical protein